LHRKDQSSIVEVFQDIAEERDEPIGIYSLTTVITKRSNYGSNHSNSLSLEEEESTSRTQQQGTSDDESTVSRNTRRRKNSNSSTTALPVPILSLADRVLQNPQQPKEQQKKQKKSRQVSSSAPKEDEAFSSISVVVEQTVIDVDDWYPYFANVWSMKCGQLPHGGRLKRLATLKELSMDYQMEGYYSIKSQDEHKYQERVKNKSLLTSILDILKRTWSQFSIRRYRRYAKVDIENNNKQPIAVHAAKYPSSESQAILKELNCDVVSI
jgi:hypothetical protein